MNTGEGESSNKQDIKKGLDTTPYFLPVYIVLQTHWTLLTYMFGNNCMDSVQCNSLPFLNQLTLYTAKLADFSIFVLVIYIWYE